MARKVKRVSSTRRTGSSAGFRTRAEKQAFHQGCICGATNAKQSARSRARARARRKTR